MGVECDRHGNTSADGSSNGYAFFFKPNHSELFLIPQAALDANYNLKQDYGGDIRRPEGIRGRVWAGGLLLLLFSFAWPPQKIKVWLVGDSTMADKEVRAFLETGWGMPFANFFDSTIVVDNRAENGRSTKSFIAEGLWAKVLDGLQEGDYVLIQFGHNDEGKEKTGRYTTLGKNSKAGPYALRYGNEE